MTFRSAAGAAAFSSAYEAVLARWPLPVEPVDVRSAYGTTHVQVCGPPDGSPLVLLHAGTDATSTVWVANAGALGGRHRLYAVDFLGGAGRSVADGRPMRTRADLMDWLDQLLTGLGLDRAHLCGHSYGAWLALNYALHAPRRVRRLALLEPSMCFGGLRLTYRLRAVPLLARPNAARCRAFLAWETGGTTVDPDWLHLACLAAQTFQSAPIVMPRRPAAHRLRTLTTPTLILLAEHSRQHHIGRIAATARQQLPDVHLVVLPDVTHHSTPMAHPDRLNDELLAFLD